MRKPISYSIAALWLAIVCSFNASAVTFEVTTAEEFQAALSAAASNGANNEIVLSDGVFKGNFKYVAEHGSGLSIRGKGSTNTILDGEQRAFVLFLSLGEYTPEIEVSALALTQGKARTGAALRIASDTAEVWYDWTLELHPKVRLRDLDISSNFGGIGLEADGSILNGAGVYLKIENTKINSNTGAVIECIDSCVTHIKQSSLDGSWENAQTDTTGSSISSGSLILEESSLRNIRLTSFWAWGGDQGVGIYVSGSKLHGEGRIECSSTRAFEIKNSTIGGPVRLGLSNQYKNPKTGVIENNKFSDGAIRVSGERILFVGNLVASPLVNVASAIAFESYVDLTLVSNTLVNIDTLRLSPLQSGKSQLLANNIITSRRTDGLSPIVLEEFPESSALIHNILPSGNYGYWDQDVENTQAEPSFFDIENRDYHLTLSSIGIDEGNAQYVLDGQDFDLDGNPRVLGSSVDIGAYERSTAALHPADTNGDSSISREEFDTYNAAWRRNESWPNPPASIEADYVTRAGYLLQKGGAYKNIGVGKPVTWVPVNE